MTGTPKFPTLGPGSYDVSAIHAAIARGDDPEKAVEAARTVPTPPATEAKPKAEAPAAKPAAPTPAAKPAT